MKHFFLIALLTISFLLSGCNAKTPLTNIEPKKQTSTITLNTYNSNKELLSRTYQRKPQRIIGIWQNSIETLLALGAGEHLIAAIGIPNEAYLKPEYRAAYNKIPHKSMHYLNTESALMLQPDLIVGWNSSFSSKILRGTDFWQARGIDTYISDLPSPSMTKGSLIEKEYRYILDMGKIVGEETKAQAIVTQMQNEILAVQAQRQQNIKPRTLVLELYGNEILVSKKHSLVGELVETLGGQLLAEENRISIEQIIALKPEVIFLIVLESQYGNEEQLLNKLYLNPALQNLQAVRQRRLYPVPLYAVHTAGIRLLDGIKLLNQGLYPPHLKE